MYVTDDGGNSSIIHALPWSAVLLSAEGVVVDANPAWESLYAQLVGDRGDSGPSLHGLRFGAFFFRLVVWNEQIPEDLVQVLSSRPRSGEQFDRVVSLNATTGRMFLRLRISAVPIKREQGLLLLFEDVTRSVQEEHHRNQLSAVAANTSNLVIITDTSRRITWVNQSFCKVTGYTLNEVLGKSPGHLLQGPRTSEKARVMMREALGRGDAFRTEVLNYTKDGREYWVDLEVQPQRTETGELTGFIGIQSDISERHHTEQVLTNLEERWKLALEANRDTVWDWDLKTGFITYSRHWETITGTRTTSQGTFIGEWSVLIHPDDLPTVITTLRQHLAGLTHIFETEYRLRDKQGNYRWILDRGISITDAQGTVYRMVGSKSDITDRREVTEKLFKHSAELEAKQELIEAQGSELKRSHEQIMRAAEAKGNFLAAMSHEIRTPLNGIIGLSELTLATELAQEQRDNLQLLHTSAKSLLAIINDVLDFSKIEAGKMTIEQAPFSLRALLSRLIGLVDPKANEQGVELVMRVDPSLSNDVIGDEVRVGQIILNLLTNAVKFTSRGGAVVLHVRQWEDAEVREGLLPVHISVMDTGIGIPRDKLTKIFHPFEQADESTTRKFGGTGLGLSIISRLVDLMGGALKAESQVGVGSVFHVWLTFSLDLNATKRKEIEQREAAGNKQPSATLKGVRALVVEDNTVNQRVIVKILQKGGIESVIANNGEEALSILTRGTASQNSDCGFDIILMDCQMPLMDGYEATRLFRMHERVSGRHTPVIAMTAHALQGDREKCISAGMDDYISKPINSKELFNVIEHMLAAHAERIDHQGN